MISYISVTVLYSRKLFKDIIDGLPPFGSCRSYGPNEANAIFTSKTRTTRTRYKDKSQREISKIPAVIVRREEQMRELGVHYASCIEGSCLPTPWITVLGRSGSGKTAVVSYVFGKTCRPNLVMVSCTRANTPFGILKLIASEMGLKGSATARGAGLNTFLTKIEEEIKRRLLAPTDDDNSKKSEAATGSNNCDTNITDNNNNNNNNNNAFFVIVLDDFDTIFHHTSDHHTSPSEIINQLLGMIDSLQQKGYAVGIVAIINKPLDDVELDDRIRSRIESSTITFPPYNSQELVEILQDRNTRAFNVCVPFNVVKACAEICSSQHGDARRALMLFKSAVEHAFALGVFSPSNVNTSHVLFANNRSTCSGGGAGGELQGVAALDVVYGLPIQQRILIGIIAWLVCITNRQRLSGTEIYHNYEGYMKKISLQKPFLSQHGFTLQILQPRRIRQLLEELEIRKVILSVKTSEGKSKGVEKLYWLNISLDTAGSIALGSLWNEIISAKNNLAHLENLKQLVDVNIPYPESRELRKVFLDQAMQQIRSRTLIGK